jgi:hypothetical protein
MREGEHYGVIPGAGSKPTLLKPGAEKLCLTFLLSPTFEIQKTNLDNGHREIEITCTLTTTNGRVYQGVGSCSTLESKYRYRWMKDEPIEDKEEEKRIKMEGRGRWRKYNGKWSWEIKVDNRDIADGYNPVLKIAKKRAYVDATITALSASDIYTQDIEDLKANGAFQHIEEAEEVKDTNDNKITPDLWVKLCKDSMKCKDPDDKIFGSNYLSSSIIKYFGVKVPSKISPDQLKKIQTEWFTAWSEGNWKNYKDEHFEVTEES